MTVVGIVLSRFLAGLLFAVSPTDGATLVLVPAVLGATPPVACLVPARRATRTDPIEMLRADQVQSRAPSGCRDFQPNSQDLRRGW